MAVNTPEAAPEEETKKEEQPKKQPTKVKPRVLGGEGASTEVTPEMKKKIIDQHYAEQNIQSARVSYWHRADEALKPHVGTAGHVAALALNPIAYLGIRGGDFVAKNTLGKIPYLGELYNKPRAAIVKTGEVTRNLVSATLTSPVGAVDRARDVKQALSGRAKREGRGWFDSATESVITGTTAAAKWTFEKAMFLLKKGAEATGGILKGTATLVAAPFKLGYKAGSMVQSHVPGVKHVHGSLLGLPVAVLAGVGAGGVAASFLGPAASAAYWTAVSQLGSQAWGAIQTGFAALGF